VAQVRQTEVALEKANGAYASDLSAIRNQLAAGSKALEDVITYVASSYKSDIKGVFAGSVPYLKLAGMVLCGWQMARAAIVAAEYLGSNVEDPEFYKAKIATARFYADHILSQATGVRNSIVDGSAGVLAMSESQF
jgi:3-(methylthio)propanoyl-CoA dehydrogenase